MTIEPGYQIAGRKRPALPLWVVIHETAGVQFDANKVARNLDRRGYGVHYIIDPWGKVTHHCDMVRYLIHANQCNAQSVGVELISPYYPDKRRDPFERIIPAEWWMHTKGTPGYLCPTTWQIAALADLLPLICTCTGVPLAFPTANLSAAEPKIPGWKERAVPPPGIVAHRDFARHADGRWPMLEAARVLANRAG